MLLFYIFKAYQTLEIKNRLSAVQRDWAKVEPHVTAAQKRPTELNAIIGTTKVLDTHRRGPILLGSAPAEVFPAASRRTRN